MDSNMTIKNGTKKSFFYNIIPEYEDLTLFGRRKIPAKTKLTKAGKLSLGLVGTLTVGIIGYYGLSNSVEASTKLNLEPKIEKVQKDYNLIDKNEIKKQILTKRKDENDSNLTIITEKIKKELENKTNKINKKTLESRIDNKYKRYKIIKTDKSIPKREEYQQPKIIKKYIDNIRFNYKKGNSCNIVVPEVVIGTSRNMKDRIEDGYNKNCNLNLNTKKLYTLELYKNGEKVNLGVIKYTAGLWNFPSSILNLKNKKSDLDRILLKEYEPSKTFFKCKVKSTGLEEPKTYVECDFKQNEQMKKYAFTFSSKKSNGCFGYDLKEGALSLDDKDSLKIKSNNLPESLIGYLKQNYDFCFK